MLWVERWRAGKKYSAGVRCSFYTSFISHLKCHLKLKDVPADIRLNLVITR